MSHQSISSDGSVAGSQQAIRQLLQMLIQEHDRLGILMSTAIRDEGAQDIPEEKPDVIPKDANSGRSLHASMGVARISSNCGEVCPYSPAPGSALKSFSETSQGSSKVRKRTAGRRKTRCKTTCTADGVCMDQAQRQEHNDELSSFAAELMERFTSLSEAFEAFDYSHTGALSRDEFMQSMDRFEYAGDPRRLWMSLNQGGLIDLRQFLELSKFIAEDKDVNPRSTWNTADVGIDEQIHMALHRLKIKLKSKTGEVSSWGVADLLRRSSTVSTEVSVDDINELFALLGASAKKRPVPAMTASDSLSASRSVTLRPSSVYSAPDLILPLHALAELLVAKDVGDVAPKVSSAAARAACLIRVVVFDEDSSTCILKLMDLSHGDLHQEDDRWFDRGLDVFMSVVILANAAFIGVFATNTSTGWGTPQILDACFTFIFMVEMLLKIHRGGLRFHFLGPNWRWNCFDAFVVCLGVVDFTMTVVIISQKTTGQGFDASSFMALRLIRLVRLVRLARVMRVSLFRELRLMLNGVGGLMRTLFCAILLLLLATYLLAICVTQFFGNNDAPTISGQAQLFSTLPRSMFTVFRCLVVGDWAAVDGTPLSMHLIESYGWPYGMMYCMVCVLMNYGLSSLITALVVDSTLVAAKQAEFKLSTKDEERKKIAIRLRKLAIFFEEFQKRTYRSSGSKSIDPALYMDRVSFAQALQSEVVKKLLDEIEIDEADRNDLFEALDADGNGHIEVGELIEGFVKMRGKARKADVVATRLMVSQLLNLVRDMEEQMLELHEELLACVDHGLGKLEKT